MQAKITAPSHKATAILDDDLIWHSTNKDLEELLNLMTPAHGPSGADPNPWHTLATAAAKITGGKVLSYPKLSFDPKAIY